MSHRQQQELSLKSLRNKVYRLERQNRELKKKLSETNSKIQIGLSVFEYCLDLRGNYPEYFSGQ